MSLLDTCGAVAAFVDEIAPEIQTPQFVNGHVRPSLFVDLEGIDLGRQGSVSLMQILLEKRSGLSVVKLLDVHVLQHAIFETPGPTSGQTLRSILESADVAKAFFDVRNDSDALFSHYGVKLQNVQDIQLMECLSRPSGRRLLNGMRKCIEDLPVVQARELDAVKQAGQALFAPEKGGRYEVFNERPMQQALIAYCEQDVLVLSRLWTLYNGRLSKRSRARLDPECRKRITLSQSPGFCGKGRHMCLSGL
ncbi:hypothetical protein V8E36_003218 [Tilletia maclaganii]